MTNTKCSNCKKKIYKRPDHLKRYSKHFCDNLCHKKYQQKTKGTSKTVKCSCCKKKLIRTNAQLRNSKTGLFYCDNACKNKHIAQLRWKDKDNVVCHKNSGRAKKIIELSNNACQNCGYDEDKRMLDVHHHDGDHQNNAWGNLRCVCMWCHGLHHRCGEELDLPALKT